MIQKLIRRAWLQTLDALVGSPVFSYSPLATDCTIDGRQGPHVGFASAEPFGLIDDIDAAE